MRDLHDPNNPDYEKESELTREIIFEKLTDEEICFLLDEEEYCRQKVIDYQRRIVNIKYNIGLLIEIVEQTEQTLILNKLNKIVTL